MKHIHHNGCKLTLSEQRYQFGGGLCIQLLESGQPYTTATLNPTGPHKLGKDEVAIKNYSENTGILPALQECGILGPVKREIQSGFVRVPICDYNHEVAKEYMS